MISFMLRKDGQSKEINLGLDTLDILDSFPFYVLLIDEDHYIVCANKAVRDYFKIDLDKIIGEYCPKIIHGLNEPFPGCPLEDAVRKNCAIQKELLDDKTGRWMESSVYPTNLHTHDNKKFFVHFAIDITDRKKAKK